MLRFLINLFAALFSTPWFYEKVVFPALGQLIKALAVLRFGGERLADNENWLDSPPGGRRLDPQPGEDGAIPAPVELPQQIEPEHSYELDSPVFAPRHVKVVLRKKHGH